MHTLHLPPQRTRGHARTVDWVVPIARTSQGVTVRGTKSGCLPSSFIVERSSRFVRDGGPGHGLRSGTCDRDSHGAGRGLWRVSGAVFLLPVQLTLLGVPNPAVTPTNLLYNVIAGPGALLRYCRSGHLHGPLTRLLLAGTVPGVIVGAVIRAFLLPGPQAFRVVAGLVLLALGLWLIERTISPATRRPMTTRAVGTLALVVGVVGGIYGIGGGSILSPMLVGSGMTVAVVAPAALASTFVTSIIGAATFVVLALFTQGTIAPRLAHRDRLWRRRSPGRRPRGPPPTVHARASPPSAFGVSSRRRRRAVPGRGFRLTSDLGCESLPSRQAATWRRSGPQRRTIPYEKRLPARRRTAW
jgi:uncharacterized membrane protein YfcA